MVLAQQGGITTAPAVDVTATDAWATAKRIRHERPDIKVFIMCVDDGNTRCVLYAE